VNLQSQKSQKKVFTRFYLFCWLKTIKAEQSGKRWEMSKKQK
jgi:hypothetical protein